MTDDIQVDPCEEETWSEKAKMLNEGRCSLLSRVKREMPQCGRTAVVL